MKFDYIIGNPPYQEDSDDNSRKAPVYNLFMDQADKVGTEVELITPARFLFNAGQTPKRWNNEKLNDPHFKVLDYFANAEEVFPNTDIKGGVAITLRNSTKVFGKIEIFVEYEELRSILKKVQEQSKNFLSEICVGAVPYAFSETLRNEHPDYYQLGGKSHDIRTNAFDNLHNKVFFDNDPGDASDEEYVKFYGILSKKRAELYMPIKYLKVTSSATNFGGYKVLMSKANQSGNFGETLSDMIIAGPKEGHTQSLISFGNFKSRSEAESLEKYLKTKFARCLLSILKKTQDVTPSKFVYVPLQDCTSNSDIDWSKSIPEIDQQLYKKYGLDDDEIKFIETHVKEMN